MPIVLGDLTRCEQVEIAVTIVIAPGEVTLSQRREIPIGGRREGAIAVDVGQQESVAGAVRPHQGQIDVPVAIHIAPAHGGVLHATEALAGGHEVLHDKLPIGEGRACQSAIDGLHRPVIRIRQQRTLKREACTKASVARLHAHRSRENVTLFRLSANANVVAGNR